MTSLLKRDPLFSERQPGQAAIREESGVMVSRTVIGETGRNIPQQCPWALGLGGDSLLFSVIGNCPSRCQNEQFQGKPGLMIKCGPVMRGGGGSEGWPKRASLHC